MAIERLSVMSVGLRRAASLRMQRIALAANALWLLHGSWVLLGAWPPDDAMPFLVLFVLPTALVVAVLRKALWPGMAGSG